MRYKYVLSGFPSPVVQDAALKKECYYVPHNGWNEGDLRRGERDRPTTRLYMDLRFPEAMRSFPWPSE